MKRFIVSVLCVTVFCIGLGALVDKVSAGFKNDEKALALIKQARLAIGGEQSIAEVRSMVIKGNTTVTLNVDGGTRTEQGETEIALQLPDKLSKMVKIGRPEGGSGDGLVQKHDVMVMRRDGAEAGGKEILIRKHPSEGNEEIEKVVVEGKDGEFTTSDGKKIVIRRVEGGEDETVNGGNEKGKRVLIEKTAYGAHGAMRQNELLRTTLSLLATPPVGMDVRYSYVGERNLDGTPAEIVTAEFAGSSVTLYLSKATSLPLLVSYKGHAMPTVVKFHARNDGGGEPKDKVMFTKRVDPPALTDIEVRYADYRSTGGIQLPYKWTTSVGGQTTEVFDVTAYEINPANISEKFGHQKTFLRMKKEGSK